MIFVECKSRAAAKRRYPDAAHIAKVDGGYAVFVSMADYVQWTRQK